MRVCVCLCVLRCQQQTSYSTGCNGERDSGNDAILRLFFTVLCSAVLCGVVPMWCLCGPGLCGWCWKGVCIVQGCERSMHNHLALFCSSDNSLHRVTQTAESRQLKRDILLKRFEDSVESPLHIQINQTQDSLRLYSTRPSSHVLPCPYSLCRDPGPTRRVGGVTGSGLLRGPQGPHSSTPCCRYCDLSCKRDSGSWLERGCEIERERLGWYGSQQPSGKV